MSYVLMVKDPTYQKRFERWDRKSYTTREDVKRAIERAKREKYNMKETRDSLKRSVWKIVKEKMDRNRNNNPYGIPNLNQLLYGRKY